MMDIKRFTSLAQSYGGALERWPEEERASARALSEISSQARDILAQERMLDSDIAQALALRQNEAALTDAAQRVRHSVMAQIQASSVQASFMPRGQASSGETRLWVRFVAAIEAMAERLEWRPAAVGLCMLSCLGGVWLGLAAPDHALDSATMAVLNTALGGVGL
ncbi:MULTISPECIES: hypothetical protein [unclassified Asaia]|uniref:hypothetical protein n=1 Tax=unclassified Asaia TaxID=2685023 RepID=UPI000F8E4CE6|nr:hypothetical protein [Asaia sp. W19]